MSLEDDITALQNIELLSGFSRDHLRLIAFGSHRLTYSTGNEIFREGQRSDGAFLVLTGLVELTTVKHGSTISLGEFGPGSVIGEMAMVTHNERSFTATIKEPTELFKISYSTMQRVLSEYPDLAVHLHNRISKRIVDFAKGLPPIQEKLNRHDKA